MRIAGQNVAGLALDEMTGLVRGPAGTSVQIVVNRGSDPKELLRAPGPPIATACQDRVLRIPPEKDAEADKRLLRETGRKVARGG